MSFFSPRLSIGMEDKFLPSVRQPRLPQIYSCTVCGTGDAGGGEHMVYVRVTPSLTWTKVCKRMHMIHCIF